MRFAPGLVKNALGPSGIRTRDLPITSRMLYQLIYIYIHLRKRRSFLKGNKTEHPFCDFHKCVCSFRKGTNL